MCPCHTGQDSNPPTDGTHECSAKSIPFTTVPSPDGSPMDAQAHWLQGARERKNDMTSATQRLGLGNYGLSFSSIKIKMPDIFSNY